MDRFSLRRSRCTLFLRCSLLLGFSLTSFLIPLHAAEAPAEAASPPVRAADAVQEAFVRVAQQTKASVVTIYAERVGGLSTPSSGDKAEPDDDGEGASPLPFVPGDPNERRTSLGTGMVVSESGDILTNYHVVKDAVVIRVIFDADSERPARPTAQLVAFDEESDLAVLRLAPSATTPTLHPVTFGDSDQVRIGEWALAVGAPFDQAQTVTVGVISAKGRHLDKNDRLSLQDYLQTDASINPGNSGGPLVNLDGEVIGINTAILSPSRFNVGIGFAVPSNTIRQYLPLLEQGKSVVRGFLGIQYTALDPEVAREFGVPGGMQIGALARRGDQYIGPAKEAGLQAGDIITHVNGRAITSSDDFRQLVAGSAPGTRLKFTVLRPGPTANETYETTVTLGDWNVQNAVSPAPSTPTNALPLPAAPQSPLGLEVGEAAKLSAEQRSAFGLDTAAKGLIIVHVVPASPADNADLRRGLRIARLHVNNGPWQAPTTAKEFVRIENTLPSGARVLLQLRDRNDVSIYKLVIAPDTPR
jgi:serine protease Do